MPGGHEATVSKVGEDQLFYLMSHGIREDEASKLSSTDSSSRSFTELPMEYAVEMNRLIELQMEARLANAASAEPHFPAARRERAAHLSNDLALPRGPDGHEPMAQ